MSQPPIDPPAASPVAEAIPIGQARAAVALAFARVVRAMLEFQEVADALARALDGQAARESAPMIGVPSPVDPPKAQR